MVVNQSTGHQKRSRASDGAEKVSRSGDERPKRRRTSHSNDTQNAQPADSSGTPLVISYTDVPSQDVEKQNGPAPWSFSRPVGGRYSNADPIMTADET